MLNKRDVLKIINLYMQYNAIQCNGLKHSLEKHPHFYAPVFSREFFRKHSCYDSVEISRENTGVLKRKKIFPTGFQHILILYSFQNYAMKAAFIYFCKLYNKMNLLGAKSQGIESVALHEQTTFCFVCSSNFTIFLQFSS